MKKVAYYSFALLLFFPVNHLLANMEMGEYNPATAKGFYPKKRSFESSKCRRGPYIMYPGSLKDNIIRLAEAHCWPVVKWKADSDFNWAGNPSGTVIRANSLQEALRKILERYPLQAQFYTGNRVLAIKPRTLKYEIH